MRQRKTGNLESRMIEQDIQPVWSRLNKGKRVGELGVTPAKLRRNDFVQSLGTEDRQGFGSFGKVVAGQHTHQTEVMVPMQVGNKDVGNSGRFDLVSPHLDLRAFTAVYQ